MDKQQQFQIDNNLLSEVYQSLVTRRLGYDTLMWQVPILSLTAQAFLMTIALGNDIHPAARLTAAILSFVVALMSMQLMSKHRLHEKIDSKLIEKIERQIGIETAIGFLPHSSPITRSTVAGEAKPNWFVRRSSYLIWQIGLTLFALTALGIIVVAIIDIYCIIV